MALRPKEVWNLRDGVRVVFGLAPMLFAIRSKQGPFNRWSMFIEARGVRYGTPYLATAFERERSPRPEPRVHRRHGALVRAGSGESFQMYDSLPAARRAAREALFLNGLLRLDDDEWEWLLE